MARSRLFFRGALLGILGLAVLGSTLAVAQRTSDYSFFDPLIDVKRLVTARFLKTPDEQALQTGAINGMLETLNDPYTEYVPPAQRDEFNKDLTGEYVGIGAIVTVEQGWLTVVSPMEDSPAYTAGLMAQDRILEIGGQSTLGKTVDECVRLLVGTPGTPIELTIERRDERLKVPVVRNHIKSRSVKGLLRDGADAQKWTYLIDAARRIAYVRITQFTPQVSKELADALAAVGAPEGSLRGLMLDLRWNGGGSLAEAISVADLFLKDGVIVSTSGRAVAEQVARAESAGTLPDFPIVVMINGQSASASEIVAGALVENNRAIALGTRSFGKGLVQQVFQLDRGRGGELKLTEQQYMLPSGRSLHRFDDSTRWGVDPTPGFYVPLPDDELGELIRVRRDEDVIRGAARGAPVRPDDPKWIVEHLKDRQLSAALAALQAKLDTGEWAKTGSEIPDEARIVSGEISRLNGARDRLERELIRVEKRLETLANAAAVTPESLWDNSIDLTGGTMAIHDREGRLIANLQITGNRLQQWLVDADVKKSDAPTHAPAISPAPSNPAHQPEASPKP